MVHIKLTTEFVNFFPMVLHNCPLTKILTSVIMKSYLLIKQMIRALNYPRSYADRKPCGNVIMHISYNKFVRYVFW